MTKMKISVWQLVWLAFTFQIGLSTLLSERSSIQIAKQDAWVSVLVAGLCAFFIAFVTFRVSILYPNQTLIQFSQTILGKWLGRLIVIPYFIMWFLVTGMIVRQFSDFVHVTLFTRTPLWALILPFVALVAYASYEGGIEIIARCSEMIGPTVLFVFGVLVVLNWPNMEVNNIRPSFADTGMFMILRGSVPILAFFGEVAIMMMTLPFIEKPEKAFVGTCIAGGLTTLFVAISIAVALLTFGPDLASRMLYPAYDVIRYISTLDFIQNVDVLVVMVWFCTYFVKLATYFFFTSYGISQWLGIQQWRKSIWFVALIVAEIAFWPRDFNVATVKFLNSLWTPYVLPINMVGIPLLLWVMAVVRKVE